MPLPMLNDIMSNPNPVALAVALNNHPPVTANNTVFNAKCGHATWVGNTLTVSNVGVTNYWYIPAIPNQVSYCVVPCAGGGVDAYVISDQYGGCEYDELYNAAHNLLAFLHIYRGGGATTQYTLAPGWVLRSSKRSAVIAGAHGMQGCNWSVSHIDRNNNPPTVQSKFIHIPGGYPANFTVTGEDNGDTPYPHGGILGFFGGLFGY